MDFSWSEEQRELKQAVIEFARSSLDRDLIERDREGRFSREMWRECAEFGIQGLPFAREFGGSEQDILSTLLVMEGLGYACRDSGLIFSLNAQMWSVQMPLQRFGTPEQQRRWLPKLCSGEWIGAHGMSEPDSGSDAFSLSTSAERRGDHYVLNGTKTFVTNAPVADVFLLFASVDRTHGFLGVTGFVVERATPGLLVGNPIEKMGLRTSPMAEVILQDCRVPVENRLGREGRGGEIFNDSMEWERACILGSLVGNMERQLEACLAYTRQRKQFGHSIGKFQSVANRLVDMKVRLETSRLILYRMAFEKQARGQAALEAAVAKLYLSECWVASCLDAIQVHGGYGYTTEYEVERDLRDAMASRLYSGTSEIQRNIIGRALGL